MRCAVVASAESLGVRTELERQWSRNGSNFAGETREEIRQVTSKAWRFSGEIEGIASTLEGAGLPDGFHLAASDIYERMAPFKGAEPIPALEAVLEALKSTEKD